MDVAHVLQEMRIGDEAGSCSVLAAFIRIRERFEAEDAPERRARILEETAGLLARAPLDRLFPELSDELRGQYLGLVNSFTRHAALPPCDTDSGALCAKSYADIPARAQAVSAVLLALSVQIQKALEDQNSPAVRSLARTLAPTFCIFSITHLLEQPWTSAASRRSARELLAAAVALTDSSSVQEMLSGRPEQEQKGALGPVLDALQPELTK